MPLGLSLLICLLSAGMLSGRVYEILNLTDLESGFLITEGIALNPVLMVIFAVIVICCAVIIFGKEKISEPLFSKSSSIYADVSGIAFVVYSIMMFSQSRSAIFMIAGGIALCLIGFTGVGEKIKDIAIIVLSAVFVAGMCFEVIVFDVYSVYNTEFLCKVLAYATVALTLVAVFKNVYTPSVFSRAMLYVCGFLCFTFCGMFSVAKIICFVATGGTFNALLVKDIALVVFGIYALDNALSAIPKAVKTTSSEDCAENEVETVTEMDSVENEETADLEFSAEIQQKIKTEDVTEIKDETVYTAPKTEEKPVVTQKKTVFRGDGKTREKTEKIVYKKPK